MTALLETLKVEGAPLHESVLLDEVMAYLQPRAGGRYCDATVGMGGHARGCK
jgi:16S rRNA (cytosine1402-N4)-methyltransferase